MKFQSGSQVTRIDVTAPGTGFTARPTAAIANAPAGGVNAMATAVGVVVAATIQAGGSGYQEGDILTINGGTGTAATLRVTAVTGTLNEISALSGWVWNRAIGDWIEFSIVSFGLYKSTAIDLEDAIARIAMRDAIPPAAQRSAA